MSTIESADGTPIVYDRQGTGPSVILIGGVLGDRSQQAPVAELLANDFTVFNYDRRGHGESGFTPPYGLEREAEDLAALVAVAGDTPSVYGTSGCGILALKLAAGGMSFAKLAVWEPPFVVDDSRPPIPADYEDQLSRLLAAGKRGDMVELFMTQVVGVPAEFVAGMRQAPWWADQEAQAHTLVYDTTWLGDYSLPSESLASIDTPALVLDGGQTEWLTRGADAAATAIPGASRETLAGQEHNVDPAAVAPALRRFFLD